MKKISLLSFALLCLCTYTLRAGFEYLQAIQTLHAYAIQLKLSKSVAEFNEIRNAAEKDVHALLPTIANTAEKKDIEARLRILQKAEVPKF